MPSPQLKKCSTDETQTVAWSFVGPSEEFEDTKDVIRNRISKKNRQRNGQKKKMQKDKQRSTKHTHKTKDRVTQTPLKTGGELMCSGRVNCSCSTSDTHRVNLVTSTVISHERGKDREVHTTNETYPWSFVTHLFHNCQPIHGGDRARVKLSKLWLQLNQEESLVQ